MLITALGIFTCLAWPAVRYGYSAGEICYWLLTIGSRETKYSPGFSEKLFDKEYWKEKKSYDLVYSFIQYANEKTTDEEKYQLFFKGLIKDVPQNIVKQRLRR